MATLRRLDPAKTLFVLACATALFAYGVVVGRFKVFPFPVLKYASQSFVQVFRERETLLGVRPAEFLQPARYPGSGVTVLKRDRGVAGLTLLSGFFERSNELRLVRLDGSVVNRWPVEFFDLFPTTDHIDEEEVPKTNWNAAVHGALVLPDGSIVFNFTYKGTARLDRCGRTQWTLPHMTHHSVTRAWDGGFWIPGARYVRAGSRFPDLRMPYIEESILRVSDSGAVISETSILDILYRNQLQGMVYATGGRGDLTHVNDIEELSPALADRFPMFAAGDLLVSVRNPHLVLVLDPRTLAVKWFQSGPWIRQHDPDYLDSGRILVFNNNDDGTETGSAFGGSSILEVDPATHATTYRYGGASGQHMYTNQRGKVQELPNGHLLITEANSGRAFEVDANDEIVWEFVNKFDDETAALLTEATRYPDDYFTVTDWRCPESPAAAERP